MNSQASWTVALASGSVAKVDPSWTDVVTTVFTVLGVIAALVVGIIGLVQARGAKKDAQTAKDQADAAKRIADEAQRQTAAAEAAADAAKDQAEAAIAALDWETVPQLSVVANQKHKQWVIDGRERRQIETSDWYVVNNGKADAHRLSVRLNFGSDTQITLGPNNFLKLDAGESRQLGLYGVDMPAFEDLTGAGYKPTARLKYDTPTGQPKDETKFVLPREQQ